MKACPERSEGPKDDAVREDVVPIEPGVLYAFTDGSTWKANPGPIAWSVVYVEEGGAEGRREAVPVEELTGAHAEGTNNLAELMAVAWALEHERLRDLVVVTDSVLTYNLCRGAWAARSNRELFERFERALALRRRRHLATEFRIVKGHGKDPWNRRADQLAKAAAEQAHGHLSPGSRQALAVPAQEREAGPAAVPAPHPGGTRVEAEATTGDISQEDFLAAHRAAQLGRRQRQGRTAA
jgi:ribonuclease HI